MSDQDQLDSMLQECLAAYESGLSPRDCLSAFPGHEAELEPLLRQALSLRVAFASSPSEEFRARVRQRLLFGAGSEARAAFNQKPSQAFVRSARDRFLFAAGKDAREALETDPRAAFADGARDRFLDAAGASAQEALRAVPPPRLAFWMNARRRLLEAAASPRPQRHAAPSLTLALRTGLSSAVIVLAIAVAGLSYMATQGRPQSVTAERALVELEQDIQQVEAQARSGEVIPPQVIIDLSKRTTELSEKLNEQPAAAPVADKLPEIILRQQAVVSQASTVNTTTPELLQAKQNLVQAEQNVRLFAAAVTAVPAAPTQTAQPQPTATAQPAVVEQAQSAPTSTPAAATPVPATPAPLQAGQVKVAAVPNDTLYGMSWLQVTTNDVSFLMPADWKTPGVSFSASGIGTPGSNQFRLDSPDGSVLVNVNLRTGETVAIVAGQTIQLRGEGPNGNPISLATLVTMAGPATPALYRLVESMELTLPATPTATPAPSSTPQPAATPTSTP